MRGRVAGCFSTSRTPDVEGSLLFPARPVVEARNVLWVLRDSPLHGCAPAAWARRPSVAYVNGYEYTPALDALREQGRVAQQLGDSELESLRKLAAHRIDAAVVTVDAVKRIELVQRQAGVAQPLRALCDYGGLPAYVAFSRSHPQGAAARAAFDQGMERLARSGELARLQRRWAARALALAR
jgi:polar amino acid transport system substrate-binding protein